MQPAALITGKIVDFDGDPMPGVGRFGEQTGSVAARRNSHNSGSGSTNDLGEFRISDLRAGRYKITAFPSQGAGPSNLKESNNGKNIVYLTIHYPGVLDEVKPSRWRFILGPKPALILASSRAAHSTLAAR